MKRNRVFWPGFVIRRLALILIGCLPGTIAAQEFDEQFAHWPVELKIKGRVVVAGDLHDPAILRDALRQSDGAATAPREAKVSL